MLLSKDILKIVPILSGNRFETCTDVKIVNIS